MAKNKHTSFEKNNTSVHENTEGFSLKKENISQKILKINAVTLYLEKDVLKSTYDNYSENNTISEGFLGYIGYIERFEHFLEKSLQKKNISEDSLTDVAYSSGTILLYVEGQKLPEKVKISDFHKELFLGEQSLEYTENTVSALHVAMQSIFLDNNGIFDELDNRDTVSIDNAMKLIRKQDIEIPAGMTMREMKKLLQPYEGKTLSDLQQMLDIEQEKLTQYYDIIGESKKSIDLLEKKLDYYAGIGDDYEGGARYFGQQSHEIQTMTHAIIKHKTVPELIQYIIKTNKAIDDNGKISDMAKEMNHLVIQNLADGTFTKMKREGASKQEYIDFIRALTGRNLLDKNGKKRQKVEVDNEFKQTEIANKALMHLMYMPDGVLGKIIKSKEKEIHLQDEIFEEDNITTVDEVFRKTSYAFERIDVKFEDFTRTMGIEGLKGKKLSELSFHELITLGGLYRTGKTLRENIGKLKGKTLEEKIQFLNGENEKAFADAFSEVNDSFSDNFDVDWTDFDFNGTTAKELGLEGEFAEIFDLYQDINGNNGLIFDLADDNFLKKNIFTLSTGIVLVVGVATAMIILSPAVMAGGFVGLMAAGAKIGVTTTIASQLMSNKGYDTMGEASVGIGTQAAVDIASSALFTAGSAYVIAQGARAYGAVGGNTFANTVKAELQAGAVTPQTSQKVGEILLHAKDFVAKGPGMTETVLSKIGPLAKFGPVEKTAQMVKQLEVFKNAGFSTKLSPEAMEYIGKYSAVNGWRGDVSDIFIGLGDGITSSIVFQGLDEVVIKYIFSENHFNPDAGETFENVHVLREKARKKQEELEVQAKNNSQLGKYYDKLSEQDKKDVSLYLS